MSKYYYLVTGLPELTLEDNRLRYSVADFNSSITIPAAANDFPTVIPFPPVSSVKFIWYESIFNSIFIYIYIIVKILIFLKIIEAAARMMSIYG